MSGPSPGRRRMPVIGMPPPEPRQEAGTPMAEPPRDGAAPPFALFLPPSRRRRPPTSGQLARRRVFVRGAKWLMPIAAAALLGTIAFWPEIEGGGENARVSFRRTVQPRPEGLRVVAPLYRGVDDLNRPYTVTAQEGVQPGAEEVLDLDHPTADILLSDGAWVYLRADRGRYDRAARRLDLHGAVTIYHDNGTMLRTDQAEVLLDSGSAQGDSPVAAQGPFGTLVSEGFRLTDKGAQVVFTGRAQAVLEDRN